MNRKGFFISIDLIITLAVVIFLFGVLGAYVHTTIHDYAVYKSNAKMESTLNIVMNRLALSDYSCDLVDSKGNDLGKMVAFCIPYQFFSKRNSLFSDLNYKVSIKLVKTDNFDTSKAQKYIAKDISLLMPNDDLNKEEYYNCTQGNCDVNEMVRVYVWE